MKRLGLLMSLIGAIIMLIGTFMDGREAMHTFGFGIVFAFLGVGIIFANEKLAGIFKSNRCLHLV